MKKTNETINGVASTVSTKCTNDQQWTKYHNAKGGMVSLQKMPMPFMTNGKESVSTRLEQTIRRTVLTAL